MLNKILLTPQSLLISSKNIQLSDLQGEDIGDEDISMSKMRPLIYALTGDCSAQMMEKIKSFPFMGVFEKIGTEESKFIETALKQKDK